ncbi:MAG: peptide deformylase, partial [Ktedonobacteraceae bacterium]
VDKADSEEADMERCLSLPNYAGRVFRSTSVSVSAYNLNGQKEEYEAEGLLARIFQHELDHLDGILYCDRLRSGDSLVKSERAARRKAEEAISSSQGIMPPFDE